VTKRFDKYDVIMKMLEIIEQDDEIDSVAVTEERVTQITNIIQHLDGTIVQEQIGPDGPAILAMYSPLRSHTRFCDQPQTGC